MYFGWYSCKTELFMRNQKLDLDRIEQGKPQPLRPVQVLIAVIVGNRLPLEAITCVEAHEHTFKIDGERCIQKRCADQHHWGCEENHEHLTSSCGPVDEECAQKKEQGRTQSPHQPQTCSLCEFATQ